MSHTFMILSPVWVVSSILPSSLIHSCFLRTTKGLILKLLIALVGTVVCLYLLTSLMFVPRVFCHLSLLAAVLPIYASRMELPIHPPPSTLLPHPRALCKVPTNTPYTNSLLTNLSTSPHSLICIRIMS